MNRIDRLFAILTFLQSRKYVTAEKIAEKFGMSVRTVYRDIKALGESGIPISFEPQKGYFIVHGYFLPPVAFSNEEANALLLTEVLVQGFADRSIQKHYTSALNKIKTVLRSAQKEKIEALTGNIKLQVPDRLYNNAEYLSMIQHAIASRTIIELEYTNNNQETNKRQIEPIGLVFYAFSWHLIAWCHMRKDYRDFKVQRIVKLQQTEQPFKIQEHISLNSYMKRLPVNY
jgi:predicted DNA-binding transcriptional regulator YafY